MKRINDPNHARFLTFSTFRQVDLFADTALKDVFALQLDRSVRRHGILLYAWVLMLNHVHMLVREPTTGDLEPFLSGSVKRVFGSMREVESPMLAEVGLCGV